MLNFIVFLLGTILYYFIKPQRPWKVDETYDMKDEYTKLGLFVVVTVVTQLICNVYARKQQCGGNLSENLGVVIVYTIIPWLLLFGVVILLLLSFPSLKSVFSNVIGYFYISSSANKLFTDLLTNRDISGDLDQMPLDKKQSYERASDLIMSICGNPGILINQIVPETFNDYWNVLTPLMKTQYQSNTSPEALKIKQEMYDLVVSRDITGEAMWFLYTGILVISLVQLKISTKRCSSSVSTMEKRYQEYTENQEKVAEKRELAESTTYKITGS